MGDLFEPDTLTVDNKDRFDWADELTTGQKYAMRELLIKKIAYNRAGTQGYFAKGGQKVLASTAGILEDMKIITRIYPKGIMSIVLTKKGQDISKLLFRKALST